MSSLGVTARLSVGGPSSEPMSSAQFGAVIGFLGGEAPDVTDLPVVYGLDPAFGPIAGGTALVIGGINFDKFGSAPSLDVTIDGVPVDDLVVQSDTQITATAPGRPLGPARGRRLELPRHDGPARRLHPHAGADHDAECSAQEPAWTSATTAPPATPT
jgi:hypothetical protein